MSSRQSGATRDLKNDSVGDSSLRFGMTNKHYSTSPPSIAKSSKKVG